MADNSGSKVNPFELANTFNGEETIYVVNKELYKDYLWFCFPTDDNDFTMEIFHPKDFTQIQYEELKSLITTQIKQLTK